MNRSAPHLLRHRLVAVTSVAALGLAACGGSDGDDALVTASTTTEAESPPTDVPIDTAAGETSTTDPVAAEPATTVAPTTAAPAADAEPEPVDVGSGGGESGDSDIGESADDGSEAASEPASGAGEGETEEPGGDDSCLEGSWIIGSEQLNGYYAALAANSGGGLTLGADGVVNVSFFDGEYQYAADFELTLDVAGTSGTGTASGTVDGSYTVADGVITAETETSNLNVTVTVSGITMDGSELGNDLLTSSPINNAPFTCGAAGEGPTLMFQSGPSSDQRYPVVLQAF